MPSSFAQDICISSQLNHIPGGSILIGLILLVVILFYLACALPHQEGKDCYYRNPTIWSPHHNVSPSITQKPTNSYNVN